jgi:hypothetical protein
VKLERVNKWPISTLDDGDGDGRGGRGGDFYFKKIECRQLMEQGLLFFPFHN